MNSVIVNASRKYEVAIGKGLLSPDDNFICNNLKGKTAMIVSDDVVYGIYGAKLEKVLADVGVKFVKHVFLHGEESKNLDTYGQIVEKMCESHLTRSDIIIALGGGVTGDMAGFAAATYQRGIDFVQIPTTLLAMVDSSVGGKTAVDLASGKNQVGAFCQPVYVLCDIDTLSSLLKEEYENGCAEIIKYAMIAGGFECSVNTRDFFDSIKNIEICNQYEDVITKCVSIKRGYVENDEFDTGERMFLNFGHTIGHGVEACSKYKIPHGRAVAIGMAIITKAAAKLGYCDRDVYDELVELLKMYNLPYETDYEIANLCEVMMSDKKSHGDSITLVVPREIGKCELVKISKTDITKWLEAGMD